MSHIIRFIFGSPSAAKEDEESSPLLHDDDSLAADCASAPPHAESCYGSTSLGDTTIVKDSIHNEEKNKVSREEADQKISYFACLRRFALFIPYLWPTNNRWLQANLIGIFMCLAVLRVLKLLAPYQLGVVINLLGTSSGYFPLREILLYFLFNWIDSAGLIETLKGFLWIPVEQNAQKSLVLAAYARVMMLSSDFHDNKKSGELYKSIEQGTSIHVLLEQILFDLAPMMFDLVVACVYLSYFFGWQMSLVVSTVCVAYVWSAKYFTEKRASIVGVHAEATRAEHQVLYDTVGSWISVTYFNNFAHESKRYSEALTKSLKTSRALTLLFYTGNVCEDSLLEVGYAGACLLAAYQVFKGSQGVGSFVMLLNYWARFTGMQFHLDVDVGSFR